MSNMKPRCLLIFIFTLMLTSSVSADTVILIQKKQAGLSEVNITKEIALPGGAKSRLITCCGTTPRKHAVYEFLARGNAVTNKIEFSEGRVHLAQNGYVCFFAPSEKLITIQMYEPTGKLLASLAPPNLVAADAGDLGSVALLEQEESGAGRITIYSPDGMKKIDFAAPLGALYFLPEEIGVLLLSNEGASIYSVAGTGRKLQINAGVQYLGYDKETSALFFTEFGEKSGIRIIASDSGKSIAFVSAESLVGGHCSEPQILSGAYFGPGRFLAVLSQCRGKLEKFYVANFLGADGSNMGATKLSSGETGPFLEIDGKLSIVSGAFMYTFSRRKD